MNRNELLEYLGSLHSNLVSDIETVDKVVRRAMEEHPSNHMEYHLTSMLFHHATMLRHLEKLTDGAKYF